MIDSPETKPLLIRLLLEHVQLHALVSRVRAEVDAGEMTTDTPTLIASLRQRYIRHEEKFSSL